jgi:tRNA(fMet)-specific endonuclease VapC
LTYLLDTNVLVALMRGKVAVVRTRYARVVRAGDVLATSTIVAFELWYGVEKSTRKSENGQAARAVLNSLQVWAFDDGDAIAAASIRASLEAAGNLIGAYDVLIAGAALNRNVTLVTANTREFERVAGLAIEDWSL